MENKEIKQRFVDKKMDLNISGLGIILYQI